MTNDTKTFIPSDAQVKHTLARRFYLNYCERMGWEPYDFPYADAASIRYADIAVEYLGYDDDIDLSVA